MPTFYKPLLFFGSRFAYSFFIFAVNFEYPDLDNAFLLTPSPSPHGKPQTAPGKTPGPAPSVIRDLKPSNLDKEMMMDGKNNNDAYISNNQVFNNLAKPEDSPVKAAIGSNVNTWETKDSNKSFDVQRSRQTPSDKFDSLPSIPSRALKPKDLLESLRRKQDELEEEQVLLEESVKVEQVGVYTSVKVHWRIFTLSLFIFLFSLVVVKKYTLRLLYKYSEFYKGECKKLTCLLLYFLSALAIKI